MSDYWEAVIKFEFYSSINYIIKEYLEIQGGKNYIMDNYNEYMTYKKSNTYPDDFIVFDFETTGLRAEEENIIEIGAIKYKGNKKVDVFNTYVNPQKLIPSYITKITGIKNSDVINAPKIEEALPKFLDFIGNDIIIAHNANFDMKFLLTNTYNSNVDKPTNEVIDTLSLSRKYMKDSNGSKLPSCDMLPH